jgi:hypothetical protein
VVDVDLAQELVELGLERLLARMPACSTTLTSVLGAERLEQVLLPDLREQVADRGELGEHAELGGLMWRGSQHTVCRRPCFLRTFVARRRSSSTVWPASSQG